MSDTLYDTDFVRWTERQAQALRQAGREGSNLPIDWENLAEEVTDLGNEVLHKVESLTRQILIHLLKLAGATRPEPRGGWKDEVDEFRSQLGRHLRDNSAIRSRYALIVSGEWRPALKAARRAFNRHGEAAVLPLLDDWERRGITPDEVLQDGLYPVPGTTEMASEDE